MIGVHLFTLLAAAATFGTTCGQAVGKAYFYVAEGSKRCFFENTPAQLPVTVSYTSHDNPGVSCTVSVYDPHNREVTNKEVTMNSPEGKLTYLTQAQGQHTICATCPSGKWFGQTMIKWTLSVDLGDTEINFAAAAKGHTMESNERLVKGLIEKLRVMRSEAAYKEEQELFLHSSTEGMGSRVVWCALVQMAVMIGATVFAVSNLSKHFRAQKLVAA